MTKSPKLERYEYFRDIIKEATTPAELNSIRVEYTRDTILEESAIKTLNELYDIYIVPLKNKFTAEPGRAAPAFANKVKDLKEQYKEIDKEQFVTPAVADEVFDWPVEVSLNPTPNVIPTTPVESTPAPDKDLVKDIEPNNQVVEPIAWPVWQDTPKETVVKPKSKRSKWDDTATTVTLSREIKLPINGVQFSNNLFGLSLTASSYEEGKAMMDEAFKDFIKDSDLIPRSHVTDAYNKWLEEGKKLVPPAQPVAKVLPSAKKAEYRDNLTRARAMINQLCEVFPEAKQFAQQFASINPIVPEQTII